MLDVLAQPVGVRADDGKPGCLSLDHRHAEPLGHRGVQAHVRPAESLAHLRRRLRPQSHEIGNDLGTRVERNDGVTGLHQAPRDGKTHVAQADKPDVHDGYARSSSANASRAIRKLSTAAGTPA